MPRSNRSIARCGASATSCAGALQYVPELTWILFLRILDEREAQEAEQYKAVGAPFTPSLKAPSRWQDWAAPGGAQRVISAIMSGVERTRVDTERNFRDVLDEGVLFRANEMAFVQVKRKLINEFNVWCIVSLPGGVFSAAGAGVKANLLFFTKGEPTEKIWHTLCKSSKFRAGFHLSAEGGGDVFPAGVNRCWGRKRQETSGLAWRDIAELAWWPGACGCLI